MKAALALKEEGAEKVLAYCTHPVLSGKAVERIENSVLDEVVVTDTIPLREDAQAMQTHPPVEHRGIAGRNDAADQQRGLGVFVVHGVVL